MVETTVLTLVDGVKIAVPDALDLITPYVLREQQDFFEDELPFVRRLLEPGQNVVDIGANYGVYTLSMALKVGPSGHVWAFEPASSTAKFLAQSIAENGFGHVTLEQQAVSSTAGSAQLGAHLHSELRSIVRGEALPEDGETVTLVTLDDYMDRNRWQDIDFIKIDAEGEESNIVRGGRRFFANLEPLVQYELRKNASDINVALVVQFAAIGYDSYRFLPGLDVLVPFDVNSTPDPYLLNLFCCKKTRAERLEARGLLLQSDSLAGAGERSADADEDAADAKYHWRQMIAQLAYAMPLAPQWIKSEQARKGVGVHRALSLYARSRDVELSLAQRFRALEAGFLQLKALCDREPSGLRLASLARVAHDYGARAVTVNALNRLLESIRQTGTVDRSEPFLAPMRRFESIPPGAALGNWVLAAVLEQLERREWFSTFYAGPSCRDRLEAIHALGFADPDMERRLNLVRLRIERAIAAKEQCSSATPKVERR